METNSEMIESLKDSVKEEYRNLITQMIKKDRSGILIFDIQCRYSSIERDIITYAMSFGFNPDLEPEILKIMDESDRPDREILEKYPDFWLYELSQNAEDYLNDLLLAIGIYGYYFSRISESEIWGLFPEDEMIVKIALFDHFVKSGLANKETDDPSDIEIQDWDHYGLTVYSFGGMEFAIGDDEDSTNAAKAYIEDSLWAFNAEFIAGEIGNYDLIPVIKAINEMCENGNEPMKALIEAFTDLDSFSESAIDADGRGLFLSGYDGEEIELNGPDGSEWFGYRIN